MTKRNQTTALETPAVETSATQVETAEQLIARFGTKSAAIRALNAEGKPRGEIAKMLGIRYQHVRNVLVTQLTKKSAD